MLAYLARYTHRVAISNSRLIALDEKGVTFKWKDYRVEGRDRLKTMTLDAHEFIRRFLLHVLPSGFHRIRHYGLFAGAVRADNIERARQAARRVGESRPSSRAPRPTVEAEDLSPCAPLPVLRRPDDHRRDVRRPAPCAIAIPEPDQDRHLMTVATHPASHRRSPPPPAARRNTSAMPARGRQSSFDRRANASLPHIVAIENSRRRRFR